MIPKHFRPRFSIRTLALFVTLVCCYVACWGPTKHGGVRDVATAASADRANPIAPLILSAELGEWVDVGDQAEILTQCSPKCTLTVISASVTCGAFSASTAKDALRFDCRSPRFPCRRRLHNLALSAAVTALTRSIAR
jgi:hypothetical protein